jgi:hypothetical protein
MLSGAEHNDGATEVAPTVAPALIIVPASFGAESDPQMNTDVFLNLCTSVTSVDNSGRSL